MQKFIVALFMISVFVSAVNAEDMRYFDNKGKRIGTGSRHGDNIHLYDEMGHKQGQLHRTGKNEVVLFDKSGAKIGTYIRSSNGDYTNFDSSGRKIKSYKMTNSGYDIFDPSGRKLGSYKRDSNGRVTSYDNNGVVQRRFEKGFPFEGE